MARFIYEWKQTEHGKRLFRRPGTATVTTVSAKAAPTAPDFSSMKKDELVEAAEAQGVDSSGTKADIIERLEADDDEG